MSLVNVCHLNKILRITKALFNITAYVIKNGISTISFQFIYIKQYYLRSTECCPLIHNSLQISGRWQDYPQASSSSVKYILNYLTVSYNFTVACIEVTTCYHRLLLQSTHWASNYRRLAAIWNWISLFSGVCLLTHELWMTQGLVSILVVP